MFLKIIYYIRNLWAVPLGIIYNFIYFIKFLLFKKYRCKYFTNKALYDSCLDVEMLSNYFRNAYSYKYDFYMGILDHNNYNFEFFINFGDCEDVAFKVFKKLRSFKKYNVYLIFMYLDGKGYHFDVVYEDMENNIVNLFNYGRMINGNSIVDVINILKDLYGVKYIKYDIVKKYIFK